MLPIMCPLEAIGFGLRLCNLDADHVKNYDVFKRHFFVCRFRNAHYVERRFCDAYDRRRRDQTKGEVQKEVAQRQVGPGLPIIADFLSKRPRRPTVLANAAVIPAAIFKPVFIQLDGSLRALGR